MYVDMDELLYRRFLGCTWSVIKVNELSENTKKFMFSAEVEYSAY